ncbi:MAG: hypothetical protein HYY16_01345 [Planctomycetes bacterium]|nr:hypothetical protein [Planctomycetota bacterium]
MLHSVNGLRLPVAGLACLVAACAANPRPASWAQEVHPIAGERHFAWIRRLTTNIPHGTHAEAYFSPDGTKLVLQAIRQGDRADQIYVLDVATGRIERVSDGRGKTT